jgi:uncharacterized protein YoxC
MSDDNELQAKIDAAVTAATEGLASKNRELLAEVKKLKKGVEVDPAEVERLEAEIESLNSERATLAKSVKELTKQVENVTNSLSTESKFTQRLLVENGLSAELAKAGVTNPAHMRAAMALLKDQVQVIAEGETRSAKAGDKPLSDFVKEWATGDEGKHFVTAQANTGGGATGSTGGGAAAKGKVDGNEAERAAYFAEKFPNLKE